MTEVVEEDRLEAKYDSPRWSGEFLDCSMPLTFDTYSNCSYRCLYCFSFFQRALGNRKAAYLGQRFKSIDPERVRNLLDGKDTSKKGIAMQSFLAQRRTIQWGGLSDPFDETERQYGVTLQCLRLLRERKYETSFSTKGTWWTTDGRYTELFEGADHLHVKVSIITLNEQYAREVERGVDTPAQRLEAIRRLRRLGIGGVTLRLRPFIIGISTPTHTELIQRAADAGADSVSTEFLCVEGRSRLAVGRYQVMSRLAGYDILKLMYRTSPHTGYMRGSKELKRRWIDEMQETCERVGLRFYVSDADFKERSCNGSCCGLPERWHYSRGQWTEAILRAKRNGRVTLSEVLDEITWTPARYTEGGVGNRGGWETIQHFMYMDQKEFMRYQWNHPNESGRSPFQYFNGTLYPVGTDERGDLIYEYREP